MSLNYNEIKYFSIFFSPFVSFNSSFVSLNFQKISILNNIVDIAPNIYNFVYAATGYPVSGQLDIRPDI